MGINISAWGSGLAAILGAGAVILAAMNNPAWSTFLTVAILALIISIILRKIITLNIVLDLLVLK